MKREHQKSLVMVGFFIVVIAVAVDSLYGKNLFSNPNPPQNTIYSAGDGPLGFSAHLVQDKVFSGGDGTVALILDIPQLVKWG